MGIFSARPEEPELARDRIGSKADKLLRLRASLDAALAAWNARMRNMVPSELGLRIDLRVKTSRGTERLLGWNYKDGVTLDSRAPLNSLCLYENKRDIVRLLPKLEAEIEKELTRLVDKLEAEGGLSIVEPDERGALAAC